MHNAEYQQIINGMTNHTRHLWSRHRSQGGHPATVEAVTAFLEVHGQPAPRDDYTIKATGKLSLVDMLRGRTGMVIKEFHDDWAIVEATPRMISRFTDRFSYALASVERHLVAG